MTAARESLAFIGGTPRSDSIVRTRLIVCIEGMIDEKEQESHRVALAGGGEYLLMTSAMAAGANQYGRDHPVHHPQE